MMEEATEKAAAHRAIAAAPDNADALRAYVRAWPELHALVQSLQAAGLFPGLRALQISLTGAPDWVALGLAAPIAPNAPAGAVPPQEAPHAH